MGTADLQLPQTSEVEQGPSANVGSRTRTFRKFTQLRGPAEEGLLREKDQKVSEDELQVYSIKKTCGSEAEARGRRHGVSPYSNPTII